ncbi:MAG: ABC transporter ATP-binding protein [Rhizobiales bacterium]|nr:ABC transporter ATP-binding protein [Hyphomicrobiales bacterium]
MDNAPAQPAPAPAIELRGIDKHFGAVHANRSIDLRIEKGTIHGIVGENGAGKSTLMSILYGYYQADSGDIFVDGAKRTIGTPQDAISAGIGMVHQHFMLVENFTVLENVILGAEAAPLLRSALARARQSLADLARDYALDIDPDAITENLAVGLRQRVEILKALFRGAETLILDEPTGVLTPAEADHLFRILYHLKAQGRTVVLITHKLREIMAITDQVSVMRAGELVATCDTAETSEAELAELMVGRNVLLQVEKPAAKPGRTILDIRSLTIRDESGINRVDDVNLRVRAGEIVGIAGVAGNGQSELLEAIAGMRPIASGDIAIGEHLLSPAALPDPARTRTWDTALVPEDRQRDGLVMEFEACENAILGYQKQVRHGVGPFLKLNDIRALARRMIGAYDIRPPDCRLRTANFSGGNQQKIVLAREMDADPLLLLVGQPTRGVDIGAIEFIHKRIIEMRDRGKAVLLVSVELDEILSLADRIVVMFSGRIVGERASADATHAELGLMMAGATEKAA